MKKIMISVLASVPLCVVTACVSEATDDGPDTAEAMQPLTSGTCVILRPIGWTVGGARCQEAGSPPPVLDLSPGGRASFQGFIPGITSFGTLTVQCDANGDGIWRVVSETCQAGHPI